MENARARESAQKGYSLLQRPAVGRKERVTVNG